MQMSGDVPAAPSAVIDGCVHHHWDSQAQIMQYMSRGWREYLLQPANIPGAVDAIPILPIVPYRHPEGDHLPGSVTGGSRFDALREQLLDRTGAFTVDRAVLSHEAAIFTPLTPNPDLACEIVRAVNDWTLEHWVQRDSRLHALILVPTQMPEAAAAEIHRLGPHPGVAGVLLAASGLGRPFGHPTYHPVLQAAAEHGLPIVLRAGGDAVSETLTHVTAGGLPTSFADYSILAAQAVMTHLVNLIAFGAFTRFPDLRVIVQGAGVGWIPSLFWRFDTEFAAYRRETPWLTQPPSEYLRRHVRICTNPFDVAPTPEHLQRLLDAFGGMEELLIFGSGYPSWDADTPESLAQALPDDWHDRVFSTNAADAFRLEAVASSPI